MDAPALLSKTAFASLSSASICRAKLESLFAISVSDSIASAESTGIADDRSDRFIASAMGLGGDTIGSGAGAAAGADVVIVGDAVPWLDGDSIAVTGGSRADR
jgi:hypothetical protein